jgi:hypothetical protein
METSKGHLLRIVGVGFGIAVGIGGTVGSGILRTPGDVAAHLRSPWLIIAVWVFGGGNACRVVNIDSDHTGLSRGWVHATIVVGPAVDGTRFLM